jgi:toxin FitB
VSALLDTDVLSELLRATPDRSVVAWFESQAPESLFVSAVTQAEMLLGAKLLPAGKRRESVQAALIAMFDEEFAGRILSFDRSAAKAYPEIVSARRAAGRPIAQFDAQIAAIARHHDMPLVTRKVSDFQGCRVSLVDPWLANA